MTRVSLNIVYIQLRAEDLAILENKLGPLDELQIYYPKLDPALGGSIDLEGFTK